MNGCALEGRPSGALLLLAQVVTAPAIGVHAACRRQGKHPPAAQPAATGYLRGVPGAASGIKFLHESAAGDHG
ncbi:hypothetical protein RLEG12_18500 [Rhizobium leguminosarum bv. trifolii CB782]|uniref:Propionyl-coenzyme A carboxylase alpha polypeptide n=1 Tax=Rhizobium hidalgonense TaxID=1538159 RepID=A0ABX4JU51_9HYPH|nr:hypothetical protein RLEG12_18500 [Rhizobium leguminosarum bv. trifolii CB782]PDT22376.1 hypothetical protein CO674_17475 [Rhizobium hidalgonense]PON09037.1 hypothetical protein ATY29_03220 [Rhizobium hidalgonense]